jgi:Mn2+/Fe2+ NRAMP family transporter
LLALALVGTTVVPYNLFLGSGLARGQALSELRFGLAVAVFFGGLISMGVLVVGAALEGTFGFEALAEVLINRLGAWSRSFFGLGLFAAGLSSAVTAPLAAAMTSRSIFSREDGDDWTDSSWRFRAVWGGVLAVGLVFGVSGVRPVPVIILAQALNGVLLPFVTVFLMVTVNDRGLMGQAANRIGSNIVMSVVTLVTLVLGSAGVLRAAARFVGQPPPGEGVMLAVALVAAGAAAVPIIRSFRA